MNEDCNEEPVQLHSTNDPQVWAKEFLKRYPMAMSQIKGREGVVQGDDWEDIMFGWFANAISSGEVHAGNENGMST